VRVLCTHPEDPSLSALPPEGAWDYLTELERLLDSATTTVCIACPFFDETGVEVLEAAYNRASHRVRWEIFTRKAPDALVRTAHRAGWALYEYAGTPGGDETRGFHCKLIMVDEKRAILGSANLFYANLVQNLELGVLLEEEEEVRPLLDVRKALARACKRIAHS
jgi:phosphatidylserine/phosphatidylglycerophosphate/cardiolipin synthase-like enzyme